jgi:hypothetical protein
MKVRPINLKPWEARAIVAGAQTQIRRVVSPEPDRRADWLRADMNEVWRAGTAAGEVPELGSWRCPYGALGHHLWGRESWQFYDWTESGDPCIRFAADNAICWPRIRSEGDAARLSSCAIFWRLTGVQPPMIRGSRVYGHPHDPDDLRRCMLLLDQVPEFRGRIEEMARASRYWAALVPAWDALCASLQAEIANWREPPRGSSAKRTYRAMKALLAPLESGGAA